MSDRLPRRLDPPEPGELHPEPVVLVVRGGRDPRRLGRPALLRLRAALKQLARAHGWEVVDYQLLHPSPYLWTPGEGV